jgi:hypothetical protein
MKKSLFVCSSLAVFGVLVFMLSCEKTFIGPREENSPPEVWLSSGPVEGDTTGYQVHFYWGGWDPDGEVKRYEFVVAPGNPYGFNREDTTGLDKWTSTSSHDSVFRVSANDRSRIVWANNKPVYTRYDKTHTFFLRAVDLEGGRSPAVYRSFTAWTLAPYVQIDRPPAPAVVTVSSLSRVITFGWTGKDPIDSADNLQDPDSVRYLYSQVVDTTGTYRPEFNIVDDLNANPWRYEKKWSPWIWYRAGGDSGRVTVLGDDEILEMNMSYIFAVQAKDEAGAVTGIFDRLKNVRQFIVSQQAGPILKITEPFLGGFSFLGSNVTAEKRDLPPGVPLKFSWHADASSYGGQVVCFQWGWDVADVNNPSDWDSDCSPYNLAMAKTWYAGVHTLFVRVVDNAGTETLGQIEINVIPFLMDRNLLWVDDFPSGDFKQEDWAMPTEKQHDDFWLGLCSRATGFDPLRDVYDAAYGYNTAAPKVSLISRYKNIIWTYSSSTRDGAWDDVVLFTPESLIGQGTVVKVNYLALFLAKGGHVLTEGNSDQSGGLASCLQPGARMFPMNLKCEIVANADGCEGDTSGVNSYAYKDYCVTMLDKIVGALRTDNDMPRRQVRNYDCMTNAYKTNDAWNDSIPGMPDNLELWSEITASGRFFDPEACADPNSPKPCGFTLLEVYDPQYWMDRNLVSSQGCFHPIYRMHAKRLDSALNEGAIALYITKYANITPDAEGGLEVAAPSFHFGFELWYFNRDQVNAIINTIFNKWQILASS